MNWFHHTYSGNPLFVQDDEALRIINDSADDRGSWIGHYGGPVTAGEQYQLQGSWTGGTVAVVFLLQSGSYNTITPLDPGAIVEVPPNTISMRLDGRLWREEGTAKFTALDLIPVGQDPDPEPDPGLPVPPPDTTQKHHVTGYKWGRNIFLMVHTAESEPSVPPEFAEPYAVQGHQSGRNIYLQIGFPFYASFAPVEESAPMETLAALQD